MWVTRFTPTFAKLIVLVVAIVISPLTAQGQDIPHEYRIGPEDVLRIMLWENDAMNCSVIARRDGKISLPPINDVRPLV